MSGSKFEAKTYVKYRPLYPEKLFLKFISQVLKSTSARPLVGVDLGAGSGFGTRSLFNAWPKDIDLPQMSLIDLDPILLGEAKKLSSERGHSIQFFQSASDHVPLSSHSADFIMIGSAWHWMNSESTVSEILRVLKPRGNLIIFEYQFPKAEAPYQEMNEWIRRQFNLQWRAPNQKPRGSLKELTDPIRSRSEFRELERTKLFEPVIWNHEQFCGFLFSQSRFLHYLDSYSEGERHDIKDSIGRHLETYFPSHSQEIPFKFTYEAFHFQP